MEEKKITHENQEVTTQQSKATDQIKAESVKSEKKRKTLVTVTLVTLLVVMVLLIVYGVNNPEFPLVRVLLIGLGVLMVAFGIFWLSRRASRIKEQEEKSQEEQEEYTASREEMINIAKDILERPKSEGGGENHIMEITISQFRYIGGNKVFHLGVYPLYIDKGVYHWDFIFNAHKPDDVSIYPNLSKHLVNKRMNEASMDPDVLDVEIKKTENPLLGTTTEERKVTHKRKKKKKPQEEDLET